MNTISLVGSVSRLAGGLFESVRRLHQHLLETSKAPEHPGDQTWHLTDDPVHVNVLGLRDEFTQEDLEAWHPVPVQSFTVRGFRSFGYAPGILRKLMATNPDLVHVHGLWKYSSVVAVSWSHRWSKPFIVSPHGMLDAWALKNSAWRKGLAWAVYERRHLREASCIRALCQAEAQAIQALGLRKPICIIPNGVDVPERVKEAPSRLCNVHINGALPGAKILLYLGRIHPKKGLGMLLRAWAETPRPREWKLVMAGWDQAGHEACLKRLADELGIRWADAIDNPRSPASVFFVGPKVGPNKRKWLRGCDAAVLPSYSEGLPMAILEAWAHGKPVLITPQCHLPEGLDVGAAISIQPDSHAIGRGLQQLFGADLEVLKRMGARGRELVQSRFGWPGIVGDLREVYRWLVKGGSKPGCLMNV
jgi:poly(glycerol-phosphate) alpha-glucosyltransferase